MTKILLVQGANLTFLGRREPATYGTATAAELDTLLQSHARKHGYALDIFYSNIEGEAINRIYQAVDEGFEGLVMNPAGFTYAGFALKDCLKGAGLFYVEAHISNIAKRGINCIMSDVAEGFITGFGMHSYILRDAGDLASTAAGTQCWRSVIDVLDLEVLSAPKRRIANWRRVEQGLARAPKGKLGTTSEPRKRKMYGFSTLF